MYQIDTSLTLFAFRRMEGMLAQSNALFVKTIDDTIALSRAILNFEAVELAPDDNLEWMFPIIKTAT